MSAMAVHKLLVVNMLLGNESCWLPDCNTYRLDTVVLLNKNCKGCSDYNITKVLYSDGCLHHSTHRCNIGRSCDVSQRLQPGE